MTNPTIFSFHNQQIRVQIVDNEPYFCLGDVANILDIINPNAARFHLNAKGIHKMYTLTKGGKQQLTFINEPNLYRIIFKSRKAEAVAFQDWVFEQVLPTIRKTGKYETKPDDLSDEGLQIIVGLYQSAKLAHDFQEILSKDKDISQHINAEYGAHWLYSLQHPLATKISKTERYIQKDARKKIKIHEMISLRRLAGDD